MIYLSIYMYLYLSITISIYIELSWWSRMYSVIFSASGIIFSTNVGLSAMAAGASFELTEPMLTEPAEELTSTRSSEEIEPKERRALSAAAFARTEALSSDPAAVSASDADVSAFLLAAASSADGDGDVSFLKLSTSPCFVSHSGSRPV